MADNQTTIKGTARNVEWREEDSYTILTFNVERTHEGNIIGNVPVYFRGRTIKGTLVDGDGVEVPDKIDTDGRLIPGRIFNERTKSWITSNSSNKGFIIFLFPFIGALIGGAIGRPDVSRGFLFGFIGGCFLAVFTFILLSSIYAFKE